MRPKNKTRRLKKGGFPSPGPEQCHPNVHRTGAKGCFPDSLWKRVAQELNAQGGGAAGGRKGVKGAGAVDANMKAIAAHLGVNPRQQASLLKALPLDEEEKRILAQQYLRPEQPTDWKDDPDMWLDSVNIATVMKQYEDPYPQFKFLGPYPIDFAAKDPYTEQKRCIIGEMCNLDLKSMKAQGKTNVGIVYNLDPHYKGGSHWVANYIDIPRHKVYYFDSYGMDPPMQVRKFMQWLTIQDPRMRISYNGRRFQFRDSECGMYCMYFLIRMLMGDGFKSFVRRSPPDSYMLDLRDYLFST